MEKFGERLKAGRIMKGYSLQDLADALGNRVTRQALSKYENGLMNADSEVLLLICKALGVRPDYFSRETWVGIDKVEFRNDAKFSVKEKKSILERIRESLSRYVELEEILGINTAFKLGFNIGPVASREDVENAAIELRKKWKLGTDPIFNLIELLEDHHIKVVELESDNGAIDGVSLLVNGSIPVIVLNRGTAQKRKPLDRIRFTAMHELGHLVLPLEGYSSKEKEKFCHYFAAAMLLPKDIVLNEVGASRTKVLIPELGGLKLQYGISIQAIAYRLRDLGVISESYSKRFASIMEQSGYRKVEPFEYPGYEASYRFNQLLFKALGEELISMSKAAALKNLKTAEFREQYLVT